MNGDRPVFSAEVTEEESTLCWAERFYQGIRPRGRLLRKEGGSLWISLDHEPPTGLWSVDEFRGRIHAVYDIRKVRKLPSGHERSFPYTFSHSEALSLFHSPATQYLPLLSAVILEPAIIEREGKLELTKPGFDEDTGIFYFLKPGEDPITPLDGTKHLQECFSAVPFEDIRYRNNLIAWLLGAVFLNPDMEPPMMVITGNQPGIGKTKTMESAGMILTGQFTAPVDHQGDEFEKQLSARFKEGARFIAFDNIVTGSGKSYKNAKLCTHLTSGWSKKVRILGHSRSVEQKGVLFALTANDAKLDTDLATRSLAVKLYTDTPKPMHPFVRAYAQEYRREIYGELLWLGLHLCDGSFDSSALFPDFRFRRWLSFVLPAIKTAFGELAIDEARELDDAVADLFSWGNDLPEGQTFDSSELIQSMNRDSEKLKGIVDRFYSVTSERSKKIAITKFLNTLVAGHSVTVAGTVLSLRHDRKGDSNTVPRFKFVRLSEKKEESCPEVAAS